MGSHQTHAANKPRGLSGKRSGVSNLRHRLWLRLDESMP